MSKKYSYICVCNNNLDMEKHIQPEELDYYISLGYSKGKLKSTKDKVSKSLKGRELSNTVKENMRIAQNRPEVKANKQLKCGKPHTQEEKDKISAFHKGRTHSKEHNKNVSEALKGRKLSDRTKKKLSQAKKGKKISEEVLRIRATKSYLTRKKNNTFNSSNEEQMLYESLLKDYNNKTILRQYKDSRYPFYCDFYIVEEDLFIELNAHWTHGGRPFDPDDKECQEKLKLWQEKAKHSKFYENAIETWTKRDVKKQRIAKENNLNYKAIY